MSAQGKFTSTANYGESVGSVQLKTPDNGKRHNVAIPIGGRAERSRARNHSELPRRVLNIVLAVLGLVLVAPLMLVIALLIRLTSRGPVLYLQTRVGLDRRDQDMFGGNGRRHIDYGGRLFTIYKFRTMTVDSHSSDQMWAQQNDPRVTPIGRILRNYRLDELPQLFNVVKGDMSIVGPRPEQPKIFADLRNQIERYPHRQRVLPGITGWAQVNQSYDSCVEDVRSKLRYDLEYIDRQCLREDIRVMFRTFPVVFFRRGSW